MPGTSWSVEAIDTASRAYRRAALIKALRTGPIPLPRSSVSDNEKVPATLEDDWDLDLAKACSIENGDDCEACQ